MISFQMRNMPGGEYDVTGALINTAGHELSVVRAHVNVIDSADQE